MKNPMNEVLDAYAESLARMVGGVFAKRTDNVLYAAISIKYDEIRSDTPHFPLVATVHLALYAPNNYVSVYAAVTDRPVMSPLDLPWTFLCSHDTSWREDGVRSVLRAANKAAKSRAEVLFPAPEFLICPHFSMDKLSVQPHSEVIKQEHLENNEHPTKLDFVEFMSRQSRQEA